MTQKIVYNACYGGFGLSEEAVQLYAKKAGITIYTWKDGMSHVHTLIPEEEYKAKIKSKNRDEAIEASDSLWFDRDLRRDDPILVAVVEELGSVKASGDFAKLRIAEIDDGLEWEIDEYDGRESVVGPRAW